ncbi:MAG: amidohydrolase family protein, partial [Dehalococcoidia bacterium]
MDRRTVSADSHIIEPPDLWVQRIDARYRDRAPRIVSEPEGDFFVCEDRKPDPVGTFVTPFFRQEPFAKRFEEGQRGGWDPDARLQDMAADGVEAEVLYPNLAMRLYGLSDPGLQRACFQAYNDWLAEYCSAHPKQLYGIALVSLYDVDASVTELRRARKIGLSGAAVWADPPEGLGFLDDRYDAFWAEAQDLQTPVSLHTFTGRNREMNDVFLA